MSLAKARKLCKHDAVLDWSFDIAGEKVLGRVQDPHRFNPYQVELCLYDQNESGETYISGKCSCPDERDCLHVSALALMLLKDLQDMGEEPPVASPAVPELEDHRNVTDDLYPPFAAAWLTGLASTLENNTVTAGAEEYIIYQLSADRRLSYPQLQIEPRIARRLKSGGPGADRPYNWRQLASGNARFVTAIDRSIAKLWVSTSPKDYQISPSRPLLAPEDPDVLNLLLARIISSGRAYWENQRNSPLKHGPARDGMIEWVVGSDGYQSPQLVLDQLELQVLYGSSPWYVDASKCEVGPINLPFARETALVLRAAPRIAPHDVAPIRHALQQISVHLPLPLLEVAEEVRSGPPVPCLHLQYQNYKHKVLVNDGSTGRSIEGENAAVLSYDYGFDTGKVAQSWQTYRWLDGRTSVITKRNVAFEKESADRLSRLGFVRTGHGHPLPNQTCWVAKRHDQETWLQVVQEALPPLREEGWVITTDPSFQFRVVEADSDWQVQIDETSGFWFSLALGVDVDGERISLLPVLTEAIRAMAAESSLACLDRLNKHGKFYAPLPDGRLIALPFDRARAILSCVIELLSKNALSSNGRLSVSIPHVMALLESEGAGNLGWQGGDSLRELAEQIKTFDIKQQIDEPAGFCAALRPYQKEVLRWLEFISAIKLGGILADDMGLGKTVQLLAHITREKREGRLDRPCLVLCPTSVVPNWLAEAERLAPDLSVLSLHGADRAERFDKIDSADVVLSTYPLLVRDGEKLVPMKFHAVILDESQAIKNYNTKAAQTVLQLDAGYRICLTGTPIENHLGELWSQFNFLMPGYLGDKKTFERVFQLPIEDNDDRERLQLLSSRINPFVVRRTKEQVAQDLPAKTIMIKHIELEGKQRDLYETLRLSMHEHVLSEVKKRGLASCQLIILDAILKLRQVCCDPRLVKLPAAAGVDESAKLEYLKSMIGQLLEENRRVLVFSQFTSMLDLIAEELRNEGTPFVELRGDTKDRAAPVRSFQQGEVPLFLISLRAGGTGLNLTAADTIIHYDPWWNPAVEEQATDRAHRIGQDKPVFVYRLVAAGTIEQLMLERQEHKRQLANSLLSQSTADDVLLHLDESGLEALFAPLNNAHSLATVKPMCELRGAGPLSASV